MIGLGADDDLLNRLALVLPFAHQVGGMVSEQHVGELVRDDRRHLVGVLEVLQPTYRQIHVAVRRRVRGERGIGEDRHAPGTPVTPDPAQQLRPRARRVHCSSDAARTNPMPSARRCARSFSSPIASAEAV